MFPSMNCCSLQLWFLDVFPILYCWQVWACSPVICVMYLDTHRTYQDFRSWFSRGDHRRGGRSRRNWNSQLATWVCQGPSLHACACCLDPEPQEHRGIRVQTPHMAELSDRHSVRPIVVTAQEHRTGAVPPGALLCPSLGSAPEEPPSQLTAQQSQPGPGLCH